MGYETEEERAERFENGLVSESEEMELDLDIHDKTIFRNDKFGRFR